MDRAGPLTDRHIEHLLAYGPLLDRAEAAVSEYPVNARIIERSVALQQDAADAYAHRTKRDARPLTSLRMRSELGALYLAYTATMHDTYTGELQGMMADLLGLAPETGKSAGGHTPTPNQR